VLLGIHQGLQHASRENDLHPAAHKSAIIDRDHEQLVELKGLISGLRKSISMYPTFDDPLIQAGMEEIMSTIRSIDSASTPESFMKFAIELDSQASAQAANLAIVMLSESDWDVVYVRRGAILRALNSAKKFSAEEVTRYQNDDNAWTEELFVSAMLLSSCPFSRNY